MAKKKNNTVTGIELGSAAIYSAQCLVGSRVISNISIQPMAQNSGDYWSGAGESLKELVEHPSIKLKGESVISSLPGDYAIIRKICIDKDEEDLQDALEWEFSQQIIDSREEYLFDYQEFNSDSGNSQRYFLIIGYRKKAVEKYTGFLKDFRLKPFIIDLDLFALINVFEANYADSLDKAALLVLSRENTSKIVLTLGGEFVDYEILENSALDGGADAFCSGLEKGIANILSSNPGTAGENRPPLYFTGPLFSDADFWKQVSQKTGNSELLYPFREVSCSAGMKEEDLKKYSPQLGVAVGLALRGAEEAV